MPGHATPNAVLLSAALAPGHDYKDLRLWARCVVKTALLDRTQAQAAAHLGVSRRAIVAWVKMLNGSNP